MSLRLSRHEAPSRPVPGTVANSSCVMSLTSDFTQTGQIRPSFRSANLDPFLQFRGLTCLRLLKACTCHAASRKFSVPLPGRPRQCFEDARGSTFTFAGNGLLRLPGSFSPWENRASAFLIRPLPKAFDTERCWLPTGFPAWSATSACAPRGSAAAAGTVKGSGDVNELNQSIMLDT